MAFRRVLVGIVAMTVMMAATTTGGQPAAAAIDEAELASAIDVPADSLESASLGGSDEAGMAILNEPLAGFPVTGNTYLVLSSGEANHAVLPNDEPNRSSVLDGSNNSQGNDLAQLELVLEPPAGTTCVRFDFRFFSDEFPEFVGSSFNDAFTAEMGQTDLTIENNQVNSPFNFSFDSEGNPISINATVGVEPTTETTYDGLTPLLTAVSPVDIDFLGGREITRIYLSIQDLGDSIYDSAAFVDNVRWQSGGECEAGVESQQDSDGDALPDRWETDGLDVDGDGAVDVDLAGMGADPRHKDIFVELDWMSSVKDYCFFFFCFTFGHSHQPKPLAVQRVIDAFANAPVDNPDGTTGINLHVDAGPNSVMDPRTGALWGTRADGERIDEIHDLGTQSGGTYNWAAFDALKNLHFDRNRSDVFHYGVFGHTYGDTSSSGISRGIPGGDFLVTLGSEGFDESVTEQAGTFMHEFGHNLGLRHGGGDHANHKPNYLSIMNYDFQLVGLRVGGADGVVDYSGADLHDLDETALDEGQGLDPDASVNGFGTRWQCPGGGDNVTDHATANVDWDCDGAIEGATTVDLTGGTETLLEGYNDWSLLRFDGGAVGALGDEAPPQLTEIIDPEFSELTQLADLRVVVEGPGPVTVPAGVGTQDIPVKIRNMGHRSDSYDVEASTSSLFVDLTGVPSTITLGPGEDASAVVTVDAPSSAAGSLIEVRVAASSSTNPLVADQAVLDIAVVDTDEIDPGEGLPALIAALRALADAEPDAAKRLDGAADDLESASVALADDDAHRAALAFKNAVLQLTHLSGHADVADDALAAAQVSLSFARTTAVDALDEAGRADGDPALIEEGQREIDRGDRHRVDGDLKRAADAYKRAAALAEQSVST